MTAPNLHPALDIRIIREPEVYLLGRQTVDNEELRRFLRDHNFANWSTDSPCDAETLVEVAARNCYQSFRGGRPHDEHLKHLLEVGHGSVVEHAVWSLLITGVSRSLTHELIRHRHLSYSQLSQRYVDESVAEYVEPDVIAADPELHALWLDAVAHSHRAYVQLAEKLAARLTAEPDRTARRKAARQAARSVLPNATETKIFCTLNARAARNFLEQRGSRHAEPEIRKLANKMLDILQRESPHLFNDYERVALPDGTFELTTPFRKV
jgi:thymidylate synthase (FAD)